MSKTERRPRLTAARKFELYLATRSADAPLGKRVADGSVVAMNRGNAWGAKGPCCW